ncbi:MAG: hypothetical protein JW719_05500, partial [Pirellulales bacterium]|nr:hypothetical protein [Pirellulales bacterium]
MKEPCLWGLVVFSVSILLLLPGAATAALTWDADTATAGIQEGAGTWQDGGTNWYDNVAWSNASPTVAVFGDVSATGEIGEVTVADDGVTATGLTFNKGYTLKSDILGPSVLTLAPDGGATPVITMFKSNNPTISTELTGGDINVDGANGGYLYLGAANSWTGNLSVIN